MTPGPEPVITPAVALERLEQLERLTGLNAVVDIDPDPTRAPSGVLAGVPVAIKNIIDVQGLPTRMGSPWPAPEAAGDALLVARLRAAGAWVVATTQCLEWAAGFAHPAVGDTRNPHDPAVTAGGSSGGSAAVVAAGAVPLAIGTDTGGSIRIPAAYCGVAGLKATTGLIPLDGVQALSPTLDCAGAFARSASSLWPVTAVMAGLDPSAPSGPSRSPVLGVLEDQFADPSVAEAGRFDEALHRLSQGGVELRPVRGGWAAHPADWAECLTVIVAREAYAVHRSLPDIDYAAGTRALLDLGATVDDAFYTEALRRRQALLAEVDASLDGVDALLGPTVGFTAPVDNPPFGQDDDTEGRFTGPYNLSGHPAVSLPVAGGRLPLGVQLAGRHRADADLLAVAGRLERLLEPVPAPELMS